MIYMTDAIINAKFAYILNWMITYILSRKALAPFIITQYMYVRDDVRERHHFMFYNLRGGGGGKNSKFQKLVIGRKITLKNYQYTLIRSLINNFYEKYF